MFILTKPIKRACDEPFLPSPPYDPRTGEDLPGVPFHQNLVRPKIGKGNEDIVSLLKRMNIDKLEEYISNLDNKDIAELIKELLGKIKQ